jgi:hypothetical protein
LCQPHNKESAQMNNMAGRTSHCATLVDPRNNNLFDFMSAITARRAISLYT